MSYADKLKAAYLKFKDDLSLNEEQAKQMNDVLHKFHNTRNSIHNENTGNKDVISEKMQQLRVNLRSNIKGILTDDQEDMFRRHQGEYETFFTDKD